jgi:hypothetical protein
MADVDEALSVETAHGVGWLRGLFTATGSRQKHRLRTVLLLSGIAWGHSRASALGAVMAEANSEETRGEA